MTKNHTRNISTKTEYLQFHNKIKKKVLEKKKEEASPFVNISKANNKALDRSLYMLKFRIRSREYLSLTSPQRTKQSFYMMPPKTSTMRINKSRDKYGKEFSRLTLKKKEINNDFSICAQKKEPNALNNTKKELISNLSNYDSTKKIDISTKKSARIRCNFLNQGDITCNDAIFDLSQRTFCKWRK